MPRNNIGIDFIGLPRGKLGVGEMVRSLIRLAEYNDYKINVIDCIHPDDNVINDHNEFNSYITNEFKYPLRIYSLTQNHIAALIYRFGTQFFDNKMNIFHLAWEFENRPEELDHALRFGDEIWAISTFTEKAFKNSYGIPVNTMHCPVELPHFQKRTRQFFKLPDKLFLYCFSFDMNSFLSRKNPYACIHAFKQVFSDNSNAGLVIKVSNAVTGSQKWLEFMQLINGEKDIFIINEVLDKKDVIALFDCCDAYLSLHRSEGFGIGMAENMLLGKPVICTGYSGNTDFCTPENSYLVEHTLISVKQDEYVSAEGFIWAEPSVSSAAQLMKEVFENQKQAKIKAQIAKLNIEKHFSVAGLSSQFDNLISNFLNREL